MKKMLNRLYITIGMLISCIVFFIIPVSAATIESVDKEGEINTSDENNKFIFKSNALSRMQDNGSFTFEITTAVQSDKFIANSDSVKITTRAYVGKRDSLDATTDSSISFTVTLYTSIGTKVGSYKGYCNGVNGGYTFNVKSGGKYYIEISTSSDLVPSGRYITGDGRVSNVTVCN